MHLHKTDTASETGNIDEQHNIHEGEGNTETPSASKEHNQHDQQYSAKEDKSDPAKEDYQGDTESLSSDYPSQKENTDEEFQLGMMLSSKNEDDDMDEKMATPHRRKNKG